MAVSAGLFKRSRRILPPAAAAATLLLATLLSAAPAFAAGGGGLRRRGNAPKPSRAAKRAKPRPSPRFLRSLKCPAKFVTAMIPDGPGRVYVASEDSGIYRGKITFGRAGGGARAKAAGNAGLKIHAVWKNYDTSNSPGLESDFITALCMDGQGRLWAGTDRHGVSVFNGKKWKHYGIADGPMGRHAYAIGFDRPADQVWIGTENGLAVYQCGGIARHDASGRASRARRPGRDVPQYARDTWHYTTTAGGSPRRRNQLPPNADCIAFDPRGKIFVGTQCGGLAIGTRQATRVNPEFNSSGHRVRFAWRVIQGPWHTPPRPRGPGLPSNLINAVLLNGRGQVLVATDVGLAVSENDGASFHYQRGRDYAAKAMGLWLPPPGFRMPSKRLLSKLLIGDHITALANDAAHDWWIGTWRNGFEVESPRARKSSYFFGDPAKAGSGGYVSAFCPISPPQTAKAGGRWSGRDDRRRAARPKPMRQAMLIGYYGSGVWAFTKPIQGRRPGRRGAAAEQTPPANRANFPLTAVPPTADELTAILPALLQGRRFAAHAHFPYAAFLRDDWATQGDWTGRYGREYAVLCAAHWDMDFHVCCRDFASNVAGFIGPHHVPGDSLREWEQSGDTDNPRSLYLTQLGYRRETTWDDHGETYPTTHQGPDIWMRVHLKKPGLWRVGMYFLNEYGHEGPNRQRDYLAQVYSIARIFGKAATAPLLNARTFPTNRGALAWARWAARTRPLAQGRVVDFRGGVYLRFVLAGPGQYMIRLDRNSSLNVILQAVFIDPETAKADAFTDRPMATMAGVQYRPPAMPMDPARGLAPAISVWRAARHAFGPRGAATRRLARLLCYRYALAHRAPANLLANWRWHLDIWKPADRQKFDHTMNQAFRARLRAWPGLRAFMQKDHDLQPNSGEMGHG